LRFFGAPPTNPDVDPGFELFDHTADLGIRIFAPTREGLIQPALAGLYAAIGELKSKSPLPEVFHLTNVGGGDPAMLLRDFLQHALYCFEPDQLLMVNVVCAEFLDARLSVSVHFAPIDAERSVYSREVKAITYHELSLNQIKGGYEARIIVDI
jgi:SHS2 domain-containing protein